MLSGFLISRRLALKIHGQAALIVIGVLEDEVEAQDTGVPIMVGAAERHERILELVESARAAAVPVVFVQEAHKRRPGDVGRELVGALTDVGVHRTFADAHQHDYHCRVVDDCVGGSSQAASDAALHAMVCLQRDCRVDSTEVLAAFAAMRAIAAGRSEP